MPAGGGYCSGRFHTKALFKTACWDHWAFRGRMGALDGPERDLVPHPAVDISSNDALAHAVIVGPRALVETSE
jgi:hypothetical protein